MDRIKEVRTDWEIEKDAQKLKEWEEFWWPIDNPPACENEIIEYNTDPGYF